MSEKDQARKGVGMPTGAELTQSIQRKFEEGDGEEMLGGVIRSERVDFRTCMPGGCPQPGDWPASRYDLDESD